MSADAQVPDLTDTAGRLSIDEAIWRAYQLGRAVERAIWRRRRRVVSE